MARDLNREAASSTSSGGCGSNSRASTGSGMVDHNSCESTRSVPAQIRKPSGSRSTLSTAAFNRMPAPAPVAAAASDSHS